MLEVLHLTPAIRSPMHPQHTSLEVLVHHFWGPYVCGKPYFAFWTNSTDFRSSLGLALDPCLLPPWPFRSSWALMSSCWPETCLVGHSEPPKVSSELYERNRAGSPGERTLGARAGQSFQANEPSFVQAVVPSRPGPWPVCQREQKVEVLTFR